MKKRLAALGLCLSLLSLSPITAHAVETDIKNDSSSVISVSVPEYHQLVISTNEDATMELDGDIFNKNKSFSIKRLSEPYLRIRTVKDQEISKVTLNDLDITEQIIYEPTSYDEYEYIGTYRFEPVYEDVTLIIETKTDLPQTGNNLPKSLLTALGALMLMIFGTVAVKKSNILNWNRKNNK